MRKNIELYGFWVLVDALIIWQTPNPQAQKTRTQIRRNTNGQRQQCPNAIVKGREESQQAKAEEVKIPSVESAETAVRVQIMKDFKKG